jgi:hypothetical protein
MDPKLAPIQYEDLFGFLNVDVSSDGTTLIVSFYDNNYNDDGTSDGGKIKDKFTITKENQ